jgi:hypothetical protein
MQFSDRKFYGLSGCTPELATMFKADMLSQFKMEQFTSGDQVKMVLDVPKLRPDGKISPGSATIISIEKVK